MSNLGSKSHSNFSNLTCIISKHPYFGVPARSVHNIHRAFVHMCTLASVLFLQLSQQLEVRAQPPGSMEPNQ